MPTTLPLVFRDVNAGLLHDTPPTTPNTDLIVVAVFAVIGVLLTIGFAAFCPLSTEIAAFVSSVS